jgi:hypothetical protein
MSTKLDAIRARDEAFHGHGTPGLNAPSDRSELLAALDAVFSRHQPRESPHGFKCSTCRGDVGQRFAYPCPTVRAITAVLGEVK